MGYLFLVLSVFSGSLKGFFGKKISNKTTGLKSAVFSNCIRMLFCIVIGFFFVLFDGGISSLAVSKEVLWVSVFAGVSTSVLVASWLLAIQKSAYTAMDAFLAMGILIPIVLSVIFYEESVTLSQFIGLALLVCSVFIMGAYNRQVKEKLSVGAILLLLIASISNGLSDFSQKVFIYTASGASPSAFNFYTYVVAAVVLLVFFLCLKEKPTQENLQEVPDGGQKKARLLDRYTLLYIAIVALALFCYSYFKTLAAGYLDAGVLYPLSQGLCTVFSVVISSVFLKEKIKPLSIIGMAVLFVGLLFINVIVF